VELKDGPPFVIDHMVVYQMFSDPEFFVQVPAFFFLKEQAQACVAQIVNTVVDAPKKDSNCLGCGNVRTIIAPAMTAFVSQICKLAASGEGGIAALTPLVNYVSRRRGFRPRPLSVYYKENGKINSVDL
jgi:hypothetical protein